ncbi:unnamed protein product [Caenorhabditis angaria]|uniref:Lysozyme n=1 Tax=Caenorhabditis angaria TaxID=860376 RepID=A0A9P1ITT3_9PELO|nr:unnamed protein product [Caenorhabditis angaria]
MKVQFTLLAFIFALSTSTPVRDQILVADSIDLHHPTDYENLLNIRDARYTTIYIRAFDTYGLTSFDKSMAQTIQDAYSNHFHVELYMAPNPYTYVSGADQVQNLYNGLIDNQIPIDRLWVAVNYTEAWPVNKTANVALVDSVLHKARQLGFKKIGIFSNSVDWNNITGNWKGAGSDIILWYTSHPGNGRSGESPRSFDDFVPFGNWTQAEVKQYGVIETVYSTIVNRDIFVLQRNPDS